MYKTAWFCISCEHELSNHQVMYSDGRCPFCGFKDPNARTIVKTTEKAYYTIESPRPWWQFWKTPEKQRIFK